MGRILRMDFHRLFHGAAFYSVPLGGVLILIIAALVGDNIGNEVTFAETLSDAVILINYIILICVNIVMIGHWNSEHRNGFIKNYAGNINGRHKLAIAKMIVAIGAYTIYFVIAILFCILDNKINGITIRWEPIGDMKWTMLLWYLIGIATLAISLFLYEITHSSALGYVFAIFYSLGLVEEILVQVIYLINKDIPSWKYMLFMGIQAEENSLAVNLLRTVLYIAVFTVGAVIITKKRDIKIS